LPAVCFAELQLGELANNPEYGSVGDLPYANIDHLRQCLVDLRTKIIHTKMVDRISSRDVPLSHVEDRDLCREHREAVVLPAAFARGTEEPTLSLVAFG
jgi:hypothetical protein